MENRAFFIKNDTLVILYCPDCRKILYEMPTLRVEGVGARVAFNTAQGHAESFRERHAPEYVTLRLVPKL